jgi:hypothetical protein
MKMKKVVYYISLVMLLVLMTQSIYAEGTTTGSADVYVNMEKAISLAIENNPSIKLIDKRIEIAELRYQDVAEDADDAKFDESTVDSENLEYRKIEKLNWQYTKLDLDSLRNDRVEAVKSIRNTIQQYYVDAQLLQQDVNLLSQDITSIDSKIAEAQLKIKLGQLKESDYKTLLSQKMALQNSLNSANKQYDTKLINLKKEMGIDLSSKLILQNEVLPYEVIDIEKLKESIKPYIGKDFSIIKLNKELELKELEKTLVMRYTDYKHSDIVPDLDIDIAEIKANIVVQKFNLEADLWIAYYDVRTLSENISLEELNLELEKINFDTIATKSKLGMVDAVTELNAKIAYNRQKNNLQRAKYNYILAANQFNQKLEIK